VQRICGAAPDFYQADIRDRAALDRIFQQHQIDAVIHFAALKSVGASLAQPLEYYQNNLTGTLILLEAMQHAKVRRMVFSSSATVYREADGQAITEDDPLAPNNPYGRSKLMAEQVMRDIAENQADWHIVLLRYFNPVGAHPSGLIGEDPGTIPNNLWPYISQVAAGERAELNVFGGDYPTVDGTGVRDYLHVVDLAEAHVKAIDVLATEEPIIALNLGTGQGYSVLQVIQAFSAISGKTIPYRIVARRAGDLACCYADPSVAKRRLGWTASKTLEDMCRDSWRWQQQNPNGYS